MKQKSIYVSCECAEPNPLGDIAALAALLALISLPYLAYALLY